MAITVVSAAESNDLTSLANVKADLNISGSDDDAYLGRLISSTSSAIESYCGRKFAQQTITETLANDGSDTIVLSRHPVATLSSITYKGATVSSDDYFLDSAEAGIVRHDTKWNNTGRQLDYAVEYTYGYVLPSFSSGTVDFPKDLEYAVISTIKAAYYDRNSNPNIAKESIPQVYSIERFGAGSGKLAPSTIPYEALQILDMYRNVRA